MDAIRNLIANEWMAPETGEAIPVVNPSDGEEMGRIARGTAADVDRAVAAARAAADGAWGRADPVVRSRALFALSALIAAHHDELAELEGRDTGKPMTQARADLTVCARYFEFYAGACDKLHGETIPYLDGYTVMTRREPYGVTGHITPWNYPAQMFGRTVAPALAAGNACVLKPAEEACLSVLRMGELAAEAGFPPGALNIVAGYGEEAGAALAAHPGVDHHSFTGSPEVGTLVQQAAAVHNRPVVMELGGKSPQIVFDDADVDAALPFIVNAIVQNAGQTCSAGSRLLVQKGSHGRVVDRLAERFRALQAGSFEMDLDCGPLISAGQLDRVRGFLDRGRADGLRVVAEGAVARNSPGGGYYVAPTLFDDVPPDHPLAQEEVFGPVLVTIPFTDEDDALRIANGTEFGLIAGVWTGDGGRQMRMARDLAVGQVYVNNYGAGGGVELPFGGVKGSGFGREKGFEALLGLTTVKTVAIRHA